MLNMKLCPSRIIFQFDTTFMTIGAALLFVTMHQKRQPTIISGSFRGILLILLFTCSLRVAWSSDIVECTLSCKYFCSYVVMILIFLLLSRFWLFVILIMTYVSIIGSLYIYYMGNVQINRGICERLGTHNLLLA